MSTITSISQALADHLNQQTFPMTIEAKVSYRPVFDLKDLQELVVTVVPHAMAKSKLSRSQQRKEIQIDVGVQRKVSAPYDLGDLLGVVEGIADSLPIGDGLTVPVQCTCIGVEIDPIYVPEYLEQYHQFASILTFSFEVSA